MLDVTATEAARQFSDLLDSVEHDGERFTIIRRGRVVAHIEPATRGRGAQVKEILRRAKVDPDWSTELAATRDELPVQHRT
ncbi:hypothetical protein BH23ACT6_BH23ACT6_03880 [soil metagenome]